MELDKNIEQQLAELLADPAKVSSSHAPMLQELLQEYPYYQPLHLLLAKANQQSADSNSLAKASLYTNGQLLHQFLFTAKKTVADLYPATEPELTAAASLTTEEPVSRVTPEADEQETFEEISEVIPMHHLDEVHDSHETDEFTELIAPLNEPEISNENPELSSELNEQEILNENHESSSELNEQEAPGENNESISELKEQAASDEKHESSSELNKQELIGGNAEPVTEQEESEDEVYEEIYELVPVHAAELQDKPETDESTEPLTELNEQEILNENHEPISESNEQEAPHENHESLPQLNEQGASEDNPESHPELNEQEITGENAEPVTKQEEPEEEVYDEIAEVDISNYRPFRNYDQADGAAKQPQHQENHIERRHTAEDDLMLENIVSADFFAFEQSMGTEEAKVPEEKAPFTVPLIEEHDEEAAASVAEKNRISNYHDDKLPYTFLWWLAKTRKEHQSIFQPYATPKKNSSPELQHQYVEHIFHIQSHLTGNEELLPTTEGPAKPASKDFEIIESFIRNDPQITPPNAEQIDNENKAKKSAEDQNDLVSETLANIYIEQMLYDKAIETYEKLSLKFPEKSRYFADLIQSIEKKI
ncbi:hypothetical protein [Pedobacter sp. L105]|uniref:hypothetical protein n=1 Tax=Pedobacter sp. L105 TaxID=1641871 RepID=UPI001C201B73|nr:hypothetical protein [Pedobacter sp. L105]